MLAINYSIYFVFPESGWLGFCSFSLWKLQNQKKVHPSNDSQTRSQLEHF